MFRIVLLMAAALAVVPLLAFAQVPTDPVVLATDAAKAAASHDWQVMIAALLGLLALVPKRFTLPGSFFHSTRGNLVVVGVVAAIGSIEPVLYLRSFSAVSAVTAVVAGISAVLALIPPTQAAKVAVLVLFAGAVPGCALAGATAAGALMASLALAVVGFASYLAGRSRAADGGWNADVGSGSHRPTARERKLVIERGVPRRIGDRLVAPSTLSVHMALVLVLASLASGCGAANCYKTASPIYTSKKCIILRGSLDCTKDSLLAEKADGIKLVLGLIATGTVDVPTLLDALKGAGFSEGACILALLDHQFLQLNLPSVAPTGMDKFHANFAAWSKANGKSFVVPGK